MFLNTWLKEKNNMEMVEDLNQRIKFYINHLNLKNDIAEILYYRTLPIKYRNYEYSRAQQILVENNNDSICNYYDEITTFLNEYGFDYNLKNYLKLVLNEYFIIINLVLYKYTDDNDDDDFDNDLGNNVNNQDEMDEDEFLFEFSCGKKHMY